MRITHTCTNGVMKIAEESVGAKWHWLAGAVGMFLIIQSYRIVFLKWHHALQAADPGVHLI